MPADPAGAAAPPATFSARVDSALSDMRSSAKWLLGAFAATGAVVFAGLQITSLGSVNARAEPWRIPVAMVGFGLTVIGIGLAIGAVGDFLRRPPLTAKDLVQKAGGDFEAARASIAGDPTLLGSYDSVEDVWRDLKTSTAAIEAPDDDHAAAAEGLTALLDNAVVRASIVLAGHRYRRALRLVALGAGVAAAGAGTFAVAVAQPKDTQATLPSVVRTPTAVNVSIRPTSSMRSEIVKLLGPECDLTKLTGVALEQLGANSFVVAVAATTDCRSGLLTLHEGDAVVTIQAAPTTATTR